jgi:uncharacterized membrane protein YgaE (UPF0421/DUF939 family)
MPHLKLSARSRMERLRESGPAILQAAIAAALAWAIATHVLGHPHPFFAPLAALVATGLSHSQRTTRIAELVLGVAVGILVADLVVGVIGVGDWQIFLVVALAMSLAVLAGSGKTFVSQAAVSAMLVATIQPPGSGLASGRFVDALVGGGIALLVTMLLPAHPVKAVDRAAQQVLDELSEVLNDLAKALRHNDAGAATRALHRVRSIDDDEQRWREAVETGYEIARTAPAYMRTRDELDDYAVAAEQMDLAVRNVRVLARAVVRTTELKDEVPDSVLEALDELSLAVRLIGVELADSERDSEAREHVLAAAADATEALEENAGLSTSMIVGQIRSTAVDLLRGLGEEGPSARTAVRSATPAPV